MSIKDVHERVQLIKCMAGDAEVAHSYEDRLHREVLREIASGADNAADIAKAALLTRDLGFERWYA